MLKCYSRKTLNYQQNCKDMQKGSVKPFFNVLDDKIVF